MRYLHTMVRISDLDESLKFYCDILGLKETHRYDSEKGRFTNIFLYAPGDDAGVTINRPPRDGYMAFVKSPDGISIEILQEGEALAPAEPWASMANTGTW